METLTLKDISLGLSLIVGIIGSSLYINKTLKDWIAKQFSEKVAPFSKILDDVEKKVDKVEMETCKNYLVRSIADFESGRPVSDTEVERFWEQYETYLKKGGNSYIKHKIEKLKAENKL